MSSLVFYSCSTLSGWWCIAGLWQLLSGQQQKQLESNRIVTTTSWKLAQVKCLLIQKPKKETREWPRCGPVPVAVPRSAFLDRRLPSGTFVPQFVWTSGERRYRPGEKRKGTIDMSGWICTGAGASRAPGTARSARRHVHTEGRRLIYYCKQELNNISHKWLLHVSSYVGYKRFWGFGHAIKRHGLV